MKTILLLSLVLLSGCQDDKTVLATADKETNAVYTEQKILTTKAGCVITYIEVLSGPRTPWLYVSSCPGSVTYQCGKSKCKTLTEAVPGEAPEEAKEKKVQAALLKLSPEDKEALGIK